MALISEISFWQEVKMNTAANEANIFRAGSVILSLNEPTLERMKFKSDKE